MLQITLTVPCKYKVAEIRQLKACFRINTSLHRKLATAKTLRLKLEMNKFFKLMSMYKISFYPKRLENNMSISL